MREFVAGYTGGTPAVFAPDFGDFMRVPDARRQRMWTINTQFILREFSVSNPALSHKVGAYPNRPHINGHIPRPPVIREVSKLLKTMKRMKTYQWQQNCVY